MGAGTTLPARLGLGCSALVGSAIAIFADLGLRYEVSSILKISDNLGKIIPYSAIITPLALLVFGVSSAFIFGVTSNKQCFFVGLSILSIVANAVPNELHADKTAPGLPAKPIMLLEPSPARSWSRLLGLGEAFAQTPQQKPGTAIVRFTPDDEKLAASGLYIEVWDEKGEQLYTKAKITKPIFSFDAPPGTYIVKIDAENFEYREEKVTIASEKTVNVIVTLVRTKVPRILRRIFRR